MIIPSSHSQFLDKTALIVVSAKEEGKVFKASDGMLEHIEHVEEHPLQHSDNEGFFFRSAHGKELGSGAPLEINKQHNIDKFMHSFRDELHTTIKSEKPDVIFLFEPHHLKDRLMDSFGSSPQLPVHTVRYGNYIHEHPRQLITYISDYIDDHHIDLGEHNYSQDLQKYS